MLVGPFCLPVGGIRRRGSQSPPTLPKSPPDPEGELGTTIRDKVAGDAMQMEDVLNEELSSL